MGKYIEINGVKHPIKDEEAPETPAENEPAENADLEAEDEGLDQKQISAVAKTLGATLRKELGIDGMANQIKAVQDLVAQPENSRLKELLNGKDLIKDKNTLTANEKIIGFWYSLMNNDKAGLKALSTTAADGGNLFPTEFLAELIKPLAELPRMRALVTVKTMRRTTLTVPRRATTVKMYWTAENAAKTTTTATWDQVVLTARKAAAILYSSDELIEDSTEIDVVNEIIEQFSNAIGDEEDRVILRGNGTTEPTGLTTAVTAGTISSRAAGVNMDFDDIWDLIYDLKAKYRRGASFLIHPNTAKLLRKIKDGDGRYIWQDAVAPGQPATLMGYPVYEHYDLPSSQTYFGNWKLAYWLGDRKQMTVKISQDTTQAFTQDETAIRVVIRLGGNVVLGEAAKCLTHAAT